MRIAIIASNDGSLINFRGPLIRALVLAGHDVVAVAPQENQVSCKIAALGARYLPVRMARTGLNPFADWITRSELRKLLLRERVELVLAYTIKPVVHGLPAAQRAGVKSRYALITGLGAAFNTPGWKGRLFKFAAIWLYRCALRDASAVMVQNADIARFLKDYRIVGESVSMSVVPGSGIDFSLYVAKPIPVKAPAFIMLSRLLRDKGINEFVAAARIVKRRAPEATFLIAGAEDFNPAAIPGDQIDRWKQEGVVQFRQHVTDVRPLLDVCRACVLPSYHEGMPRSLLEAMATGRPVITTDTIGCRETIINAGVADTEGVRTGDNGLLVPVKSVEPLAAAMLRLARDPVLCAHMGQRGRVIVEERFDVRKINEQMMQVMGLTGDKT